VSRRRRERPPIVKLLDGLVGIQQRGGCDDCLADQEITLDPTGIYVLTIRHDNSCPYYRSRRAT
jgi:hypothetical protein